MDNALLASSVRDEQIERLMDSYGNSLLRMCFAYLRDIGMAEDATQDTFVKAYQNLDRFHALESWSEKAWLMRIAINTCKDYRRSAWFRHIDRSIVLDDFLHAQNGLMPDEKMLLEDVVDLAPKYREVVLLYYYQDLRIEEIMQILGISRSTAYSRLDKAQEKLRIKLERGFQDE